MSNDLISRKALIEEIDSLYMSITGMRAGKGVLLKFMEEYKKSVLKCIDDAPTAYEGWVPVEDGLPKENICIDEETGYYGRSDDVLCSAYNEYTGEYETWIDYTIDGEWQTHEWEEEEKLAWRPLPEPYKPDTELKQVKE